MKIDLQAWSILLIALGVGYFVCLKASKETGKLFRRGGCIIGVVILALCVIMALSDLGSRIARYRRVTQMQSRTRSFLPGARIPVERERVPMGNPLPEGPAAIPQAPAGPEQK